MRIHRADHRSEPTVTASLPGARAENFLSPYQGQRPPAPAWFERSVADAPERGRFLCSGANIELLTWGRIGAPGLLFLHGNGAHADWWSHIAPFFAERWRCAALSYSGMGGSDWRAEGYTVDRFVQEARAAVTAAALDRAPQRPIIVSHSLGGLIGMLAARDEMFRGLVMVDTVIGMAAERLEEVRSRAPKPRSEHLAFGSLAEGLARFRLSPRQACGNDFIGDQIARRSLVERNGSWSWRFDPRRLTIEARPSEELVSGVRCPIAYFYGDRSALVGPEELQRACALFPQGTPVIAIADAAHHVLIDQPLALVAGLRTLFACWQADAA